MIVVGQSSQSKKEKEAVAVAVVCMVVAVVECLPQKNHQCPHLL